MRAAAPSSNSRRRRAKFRKQRFLSLSRELASTPPSQIAEAPALRPKPRSKPRFPKRRHQGAGTAVTRDPVVPDQQLDDLYPLHSEDQQLQEEDDRHAAAFFDSDDYGSATLTSLLGAVKGRDPGDSETADDSFSVPAAPHSPASSSPGYGAAASVASHDLARAVLRGRERWVLCQQQQEEDQEEGEGSSCAGDHRSLWAPAKPIAQRTQLCFLKLDYDEVLSSWSGARSVYVEGEAPQVVPGHYHHNNYLLEQPAVYVELRGRGGSGTPGSDSCGSNLWVVPEDSSVGGREARVMRYRVKRQNRLFAKRIRYEVRKLNAQKRPRIKGRFVKKIQEQASPP